MRSAVLLRTSCDRKGNLVLLLKERQAFKSGLGGHCRPRRPNDRRSGRAEPAGTHGLDGMVEDFSRATLSADGHRYGNGMRGNYVSPIHHSAKACSSVCSAPMILQLTRQDSFRLCRLHFESIQKRRSWICMTLSFLNRIGGHFHHQHGLKTASPKLTPKRLATAAVCIFCFTCL